MVVILSPLLDILTANGEAESVQFSEYNNSCLSLLIECLKLLCLKEVCSNFSLISNIFCPVFCFVTVYFAFKKYTLKKKTLG